MVKAGFAMTSVCVCCGQERTSLCTFKAVVYSSKVRGVASAATLLGTSACSANVVRCVSKSIHYGVLKLTLTPCFEQVN